MSKVRYDLKKIIVVLAGEGRAADHAEEIFAKMQEDYGERFGSLLKTLHPKDMPGEMAGKGSNAALCG